MWHSHKKGYFQNNILTGYSFCNISICSSIGILCTKCTFSVCMEYPDDLLHVQYTTQECCMEYCNVMELHGILNTVIK